MLGCDRPAERAILHVANDQTAASRHMQNVLLGTGRQVLLRADLYQAMGALVAAQRNLAAGNPALEAIVVASSVAGPENDEFFRVLATRRSAIPVYWYGEDIGNRGVDGAGSIGRWITPEAATGLFSHVSVSPTPAPARRAPDLARPDGDIEAAEAVEQPGTGRVSTPVSDSTATEPEEPLPAAELESNLEPPPVPWRPSPHRPARVPPGGGQASLPQNRPEGIRPLLSPEELDALLNSRTEFPDSAEQTA